MSGAHTPSPKTHGPYSVMSRVDAAVQQADAAQELVEKQETAKARQARARREGKVDKIAKVLGQKVYITDRAWPFLQATVAGRTYQLSVSLYFPTLKTAVDKFYSMDEYHAGHVEEKARLLNAHGVKYVAMNPHKQLTDLEAELDAQGRVG